MQRRKFSIFPAHGNLLAENSANRPGADLAVVLEISRRLFCGALPLPPGWPERLDPRRKFYKALSPANANFNRGRADLLVGHGRAAARPYQGEGLNARFF